MLTKTNIQKLFQEHRTSIHGLSQEEATKRLSTFGPNAIEEKRKRWLILSFLEEFKDLMVIILIIAAILAFIGGEDRDGLVIGFIVVLNALIGFIQKYKAEKAVQALRKMIAPKAKVIRDGSAHEIDASKLVPGDIIIIAEGDSITADAIIFEANELQTQEAALTGESTPVQKLTWDIEETKGTAADKENMIFMGTSVCHGGGRAIVVATGMKTEMGKIAKLTTETKKDLSPLQKELFKIGVFVGQIALVISAILFAIGYFWQGKAFIETLLFATAVAVAAVPEGLPATITIALAIGVQRLARQNAIVKQLSSVETLGSTTVICSDKTGTLTKNEMTVKELYTPDLHGVVSGIGYKPEGTIEYDKKIDPKSTGLENLMIAAGFCNNAELIEEKGIGSEGQNVWKILGDPTEGALLTLIGKAGFRVENFEKLFDKIYELPFDSTRKRMTVILLHKIEKEYYAFTKGAPDAIMDIATRLQQETETVSMEADKKKEFLGKNEEMAKRALRILGFAYRKIPAAEMAQYQQGKKHIFTKDAIEKNLVFLGLIGMMDPPRPEVKAAVALTHTAGIRTYIITGDHGLTAEAVAKDLKLVGRKGRENIILTGDDINNIEDTRLEVLLKNKNLDIIFARVSPEHKLRIVQLLKKLGEIVAVTGDGVNDAPALKRADIGIAMGITGTDVSKEASNMVLADDSYATIVTAVKEGRTIYENLKKFVFYIFSCNIAEVVTVFMSIIMNLPAPLTAILILCVNLGTDVLPAVALGIEPSEPGIMEKKPRDHNERIMNKPFIIRYAYLGLVMGAIVMSVYIWTLYRYGWYPGQPLNLYDPTHLKASSVGFVLLIIMQMVNSFNSRSETNSVFKLGIFSNKYLFGAIAISVITTIMYVEIPFLQSYLRTTSLNLADWTIVIAASLLVLLIEEIRKIFVRKRLATATIV